MKQIISLFTLSILILFSQCTKAQLYVKNSTKSTVYLALAWYSEDEGKYVSKGWFPIESGEIGEPGLTFTSNDDMFYYYAVTEDGEVVWTGEYKFYVNKDDEFLLDFANNESVYADYENYYMIPFVKQNVSFDDGEDWEYTLELIAAETISKSTPTKIINEVNVQGKDLSTTKLFQLNTKQEIINYYGQSNCSTDDYYNEEADYHEIQEIIYKGTKNEILLVMDESQKVESVTVSEKNSEWKLPFNLKVGSTLESIIKINSKDFLIDFFESDNGGGVASWEGGNLANAGVSIYFNPDANASNKLGMKYYDLAGENGFSSSNPIAKQLGITVGSITINKK